MQKQARSALTIAAVILVGCIGIPAVCLFLFLLVVYVEVQPKRACPPCVHSVDNVQAPTAVVEGLPCRVRVVNMAMLPFPLRMDSVISAKRAVNAGLFDGVDVVLMQEVFRTHAMKDGAHALQEASEKSGKNKAIHVVVPEVCVPRFFFTDSGLAAASTAPWSCFCIAFEPFTHGIRSVGTDALSQKGVAVFQTKTNPALRFTVTHAQSTKHQDSLRMRQFQFAVSVARHYNAHVLAGDMNTDDPAVLTDMDAHIKTVFGEGAVRLTSTSGDPTCCKPFRAGIIGKALMAKHKMKSQIDHAWLLCAATASASTHTHTVNHAVTSGWSDHNALDFTIVCPAAS